MNWKKFILPTLLVIPLVYCLYCCFFITNQTTVILVRHADKIENTDQLSAAGLIRAEDLKRTLIDTDITAIFASQYNRTQATANPLATEKGIALTLYDTNDLQQLVNTIKNNHNGQVVLVVGHSNTVPETIGLLGINPQPPDIPETEYDHLYILMMHSKAHERVMKLKYGEPSP